MIIDIILYTLFFALGFVFAGLAFCLHRDWQTGWVTRLFRKDPKKAIRQLIEAYKDASNDAYFETAGKAGRLCENSSQSWSIAVRDAADNLWSDLADSRKRFMGECRKVLGDD